MKIIIFIAVLLVRILCENTGDCYAGQSIECFSDACRQEEDIPEPALNFTDKTGALYVLRERETEVVSLNGEVKVITEEVMYEGMDRTDTVPLMITVPVWDGENESFAEAQLSLRESFLSEEYWEPFSFPVILHRFGSDAYRFGEIEIPGGQILLQLKSYEDLILTEAGLNPEDADIQEFVWETEDFEDEEGNLCRAVAASGRRRVWKHTAVYEDEIRLPDYTRFRERYRYEKAEEEQTAATAGVILPAPESGEAETSEKNQFQETLRQIVKICLEITIGLFFVFWLLSGFRFLLLLGKRWREERKN